MEDRLQSIIARVRSSIIPKILFIALLVLLLLIPVTMIEDLMYDRASTKAGAIEEVAQRWGGAQSIAGPIITIPYQEHYRDKQDSLRVRTQKAYFLPKQLHLQGSVDPELRRRGIYDVLLYRTKLAISGSFQQPDFSRWNIATEDILWDQAYISVGIPDTRGIREAIELHWDDASYTFGPSTEEDSYWSGEIGSKLALRPPVDSVESSDINFSFDLQLNGSTSLGFLPLGAETSVNLDSEWPHPGFSGEYLPDQREINEDGFAASWKVNFIERKYPQQWRGSRVKAHRLSGSYFGVNLIIPVDTHQQSIRSAKYASLFILLSFVVFFLFEILNKLSIHPIQYILVGFAVCLFYLMLVSLSEHLDFGLSYLLASIACIGLISGYSKSVLTSGGRAAIIAIVLTALYSILYVLLQLHEYALLVGSLGMFCVLALLMFLTRKIDWYSINRVNRAGPAETAVPESEVGISRVSNTSMSPE